MVRGREQAGSERRPKCNQDKGKPADLKQFVDQDAGLVDLAEIKWAPILKEGHVRKIVVDGEPVVRCSIVRYRSLAEIPRL